MNLEIIEITPEMIQQITALAVVVLPQVFTQILSLRELKGIRRDLHSLTEASANHEARITALERRAA